MPPVPPHPADATPPPGRAPATATQRPPAHGARAAVNSLSEQIGVSAMPRVLLDQVDENPPQGRALATDAQRLQIEVGRVTDEVVGKPDLGAPRPPCLVNDGAFGHGSVPVAIAVL